MELFRKPRYNFDKRIYNLKSKNKKIILYGSYNHTKYLFNNFSKLKDLNIKGFIPYKNKNKKNFDNKDLDLKILSKNQISKDDLIIISSYEYSYDIQRELKRNSKKKMNTLKFIMVILEA